MTNNDYPKEWAEKIQSMAPKRGVDPATRAKVKAFVREYYGKFSARSMAQVCGCSRALIESIIAEIKDEEAAG